MSVHAAVRRCALWRLARADAFAQKEKLPTTTDDRLTLATFYAGWETFQRYLMEAVAPRTPDDLRLAWLIAAHIIAT